MRIAMISKAVIVGAYQRKLEELARFPGLSLTVIAPPQWRDSRGETRLERAFTQGYRLVETPIALNGHYHVHFYPRLGRELAAARPDLVHVDEEPYNLATWQAMRWAARRGRPAVFFTWQNLNRRYPPPFIWMERYSHRHATHAIAGNQEAAEVLRAKGFRKPISIIPQFGVDPELFDAGRRPPATAGQLVVGYAGGLIAEKGVDLLLRAVAICNRRLSRPGACRLQIAGVGAEQAALQALAEQLHIGHCLTFLGRLTSTEMPDFYAGIDLLVLPSRTMPHWKEQFGRVLIEAMACSAPVAGSNSGEIPNVVGNAGWLFPEDDVEALADLLAGLVDDVALRAEMGRRGRARVLQRYTQRQIAAATHRVYQQALARQAV